MLMASEIDIFRQINNAVLDLQNSDFQSYKRPIKNLARLLQEPVLVEINQQLTTGLDLNAFLEGSEKTQGSVVGSANLLWPDDPVKALGLTHLLICRFGVDPDFLFNFGHTFYNGGTSSVASIQSVVRQLIIPFARDYKDYVMTEGIVQPKLPVQSSNKVFIVHGHEDAARETLARFLERLGCEAIILHEQANQGRTIIEKFEANGDVGFAVVLLTPDDVGSAKGGELKPRARQNVLLELGYFYGRLGRKRVCALKRGELELPSDFAGVVWENMDQAGAWKFALARELKAVGYDVDMNKI
jgi:hypothetical protein